MFTDYKEFWQNITLWNATATRSQYWWPIIFNYIIGGLVYFIVNFVTISQPSNSESLGWSLSVIIFFIYLVLAWIAAFSLRVRRLHDTNHSGWWILIALIPLIGGIWLFILLIMPSVPNDRWPINQADIN